MTCRNQGITHRTLHLAAPIVALGIAIACFSALSCATIDAMASGLTVRVSDETYTGSRIQPEPVVSDGGKALVHGRDYVCAWRSNVNAGTGHVKVTGRGAYAGLQASADFRIAPSSARDMKVEGVDAAYACTGKPITPKPRVTFHGKTLKERRDYDLSYTHNVDPGTASVEIRAKRNLVGSATVAFKIVKGESKEPASKSTAAKAEPKPSPSKASPSKTEAKAKSAARLRAADAKPSLAKARISVNACEWNGKPQKPAVSVSYGGKALHQGTDYTVSYADNTEVGKAQAMIRGKGAYSGSATKAFEVKARPISKAKLSPIAEQLRTGKPIRPDIRLRYGTTALKRGTDFTVSYGDNRDTGKATVSIKGTGHYRGTLSTSFKIAPNPGDRVAAAAVALAGYKSSKNAGPPSYGKSSKRLPATTAPPNKGRGGNWTVYNKVHKSVCAIKGGWKLNHLCCDCLPVLAVKWSGVDDSFFGKGWVSCVAEYAYVSRSKKWDYVGTWKSNSGKAETTGGKALAPGDLLCKVNPRTGKPGKSYLHWMIYVGPDAAKRKWKGTNAVFVDEGHESRWSCAKPLNARKSSKETYKVFRRNAKGYDPDSSKYARVYPKQLEKYLI